MEKDITTNSLIENNDIFADIANVNIFDGNEVIKQENLESVPVDASYKDLKGQHHRLFRDTLKRVKNLGGCIAFIGYENQSGINNVMPVRDMGYNYTVYAKQIQEIVAENNRKNHSAYAKILHDNQRLMPVATFVLYYGRKKWKRPLSLMDVLDIPEREKEFWKQIINDYEIKVISMAGQTKEIREKYQSDYRIIADYLAYCGNKKKLNHHLRNNNHKIVHVEQVLDMLHALSGDSRFDMIKSQYMNSENKEECDRMCLLLDMCEQEGMKKGIQEGRKKGIQEGISLSRQVIRLDASGKKADEIAKELGLELGIVESILI